MEKSNEQKPCNLRGLPGCSAMLDNGDCGESCVKFALSRPADGLRGAVAQIDTNHLNAVLRGEVELSGDAVRDLVELKQAALRQGKEGG